MLDFGGLFGGFLCPWDGWLACGTLRCGICIWRVERWIPGRNSMIVVS